MRGAEVIKSYYIVCDSDLMLDHEEKQYILKVKDLPIEEKPREKLIKHGPETLSVKELLAVVLNVGTKKEEILSMTSRIIKEYGEKNIAYQTNPKKIVEELDIPLTKACQIVACFELGRKFFKARLQRNYR